LGLDETPWTKEYGKIHPDVYKMLERAEQAGRDPGGYKGVAYVQVHLRHRQSGRADSAENKAAIRRLQRQVLSRLTALEFHTEYLFETQPGILGYVNRQGLEKLKADPDVVAVCLDHKPFPRRRLPVFKVDLPPLRSGDPATQPARGRFLGSGGKVEVEVHQALGLYDRVFVHVGLRAPDAGDPGSASWRRGMLAAGARVLASLTADDFHLTSRATSCLHGWINRKGLAKLARHKNVKRVTMEAEVLRLPAWWNRKRP